MDENLLLFKCFLEGQELLARVGVLAVDQIDGQVLMDERPGKLPFRRGSGDVRRHKPPRDGEKAPYQCHRVTRLHVNVLRTRGVPGRKYYSITECGVSFCGQT